MDQFKYLFTPLKMGPVTVPNRIVFGVHCHDTRCLHQVAKQRGYHNTNDQVKEDKKECNDRLQRAHKDRKTNRRC